MGTFFEVLFFIIYLRFLIQWPLETVGWTILVGTVGVILLILLAGFFTLGFGFIIFPIMVIGGSIIAVKLDKKIKRYKEGKRNNLLAVTK